MLLKLNNNSKNVILKNETRAEALNRIKNKVKSLINTVIIADGGRARIELMKIVNSFLTESDKTPTVFDILEAKYISEDNGSIRIKFEMENSSNINRIIKKKDKSLIGSLS